jgi:hypothetical protein
VATKKQRRTTETKNKKKRKGIRLLVLAVTTLIVFGSLVFLFITLFDSIYPPVTGKAVPYAKREKWQVTLYFADANERFLLPEKRLIPRQKDIAGQVRDIVQALIEGPKSKLVNTLPPGVVVQSVRIEAGKRAVVSFNEKFIHDHPKGSTSEMTTVYSLTNTLTANIPSLKEVQLLVNEKELESIGGHIDTRYPLVPDKDLIASGGKEG